MTRPPPPLRFLLVVVGGWIGLRTVLLVPSWWVPQSVAGPITADPPALGSPQAGATPRESFQPKSAPSTAAPAASSAFALDPVAARYPPNERPTQAAAAATAASVPSIGAASAAATLAQVPAMPVQPWPSPGAPARLAPPIPGRWSGSAWLLLRRDRGPALAQGGTLGGSQAGVRIAYALNRNRARPLALAARLYAPAGDRRAAEAAIGLDWRPNGTVPVALTVERRQALGRRGRSAFGLGAHGGVDDVSLPAGLTLAAYGQAGVVGARSRDLYADGALRITARRGPIDLGAALSGGAQPDVARLDAGPVLSLRIPEARLRISAEWRFRIAGDARPGSGPAVTLGTDF